MEVRGTAEHISLWKLLMAVVDNVHAALAALRGVQYAVMLACPRCISAEKSALGWYNPPSAPKLFDLDSILADRATHRYCETSGMEVEVAPSEAAAAAERSVGMVLEEVANQQQLLLTGQADLATVAKEQILVGLNEVRVDVREIKASVHRLEGLMTAQNEMLGTMLRGEYDCPPYFVMTPLDLKEATHAHKLMHATNPKHWIGKPLDLRFVCPVSMSPVGEDYRVSTPRDWLVKYGPALRTSLQVLSVVAMVAKVAFILCPDLSDVLNEAAGAVATAAGGGANDVQGANVAAAALASIQENLDQEMMAEGLGSVNEYLTGFVEDFDDLAEFVETQALLGALRDVASSAEAALGEQLDAPEPPQGSKPPSTTEAAELVRASYGYVRTTIMAMDDRFVRSGLVRAVANRPCTAEWAERYRKVGLRVAADHRHGDGSFAWVGIEWQAHYERVGKAMLGLSAEQISALRELGGAGVVTKQSSALAAKEASKKDAAATPAADVAVEPVGGGGCCAGCAVA